MTVTTVYSDAGDGQVSADAKALYADAREGPATSVDNADNTCDVGQNNIGSYYVYQSFFSWDTSPIPDGDEISAVAFSIWSLFAASGTWTMEARIHDWGGSLTTGDFVAGSSLSGKTLVASIASGSIVGGGYNTLTENGANFQTAINKAGTTYVVCCSDHQTNNTAPSGAEVTGTLITSENSGTTADPKLVITHTTPRNANRPTVVRQAAMRAATR